MRTAPRLEMRLLMDTEKPSAEALLADLLKAANDGLSSLNDVWLHHAKYDVLPHDMMRRLNQALEPLRESIAKAEGR